MSVKNATDASITAPAPGTPAWEKMRVEQDYIAAMKHFHELEEGVKVHLPHSQNTSTTHLQSQDSSNFASPAGNEQDAELLESKKRISEMEKSLLELQKRASEMQKRCSELRETFSDFQKTSSDLQEEKEQLVVDTLELNSGVKAERLHLHSLGYVIEESSRITRRSEEALKGLLARKPRSRWQNISWDNVLDIACKTSVLILYSMITVAVVRAL